MLRVDNLKKRFGSVQAVDGVSFEVARDDLGLAAPRRGSDAVRRRRGPAAVLLAFGAVFSAAGARLLRASSGGGA